MSGCRCRRGVRRRLALFLFGTVDEFYVVPDPLPPGAPGEPHPGEPMADDGQVATVRIMYHSIDAAGRDRAVTGVATYPTSPAPPDGRPVVSLAPGTSGLASPCATSRTGAPAPLTASTPSGCAPTTSASARPVTSSRTCPG
ncbi:MAG: hypothetical protein R2699_12000 [Acidimicrobiales bacterium]